MNTSQTAQAAQENKAFRATYEDFGLNGDPTQEGDFIEVVIIATTIENAIHKLRSSLPKSLNYEIRFIEYNGDKVVE